MKLSAPAMIGQENVLDFRGPRGRASPELKELLNRQSIDEVASDLNTRLAKRTVVRLADEPELMRLAIEQQKAIIGEAVKMLIIYTSKNAVIEFLEAKLVEVGGSCGNE